MEDTSGFYKSQTDGQTTILLYGPNCVLSSAYELFKEFHTTYQYPVDGWIWFDSEEEARLFFNIPKEIQNEQ